MKYRWIQEREKLQELWLSGHTFKEIGELYTVSTARIGQVFKVLFPERPKYSHIAIQPISIKLTDLDKVQREKFRRKRQNNKKWEWTIKFHDINFPTHCPILGIELDYFAEYRQDSSPSFDRINTDIGYTRDNTHIISWRANRIKNDGTAEEHQQIANYLKVK